MALKDLIGNVYTNFVTGKKWKIVKVKGETITLRDKVGTEFKTVPKLMTNYIYYGRSFKKLKKMVS